MTVKGAIEAFELWSKERGLVARDIDRRRVARDLFDIAGSEPIREEHVTKLVKRYRDGLMGAHTVLAARRVALEVIQWQEEEGDPNGISSAPPPKQAPKPPSPEPARAVAAPRPKPAASPAASPIPEKASAGDEFDLGDAPWRNKKRETPGHDRKATLAREPAKRPVVDERPLRFANPKRDASKPPPDKKPRGFDDPRALRSHTTDSFEPESPVPASEEAEDWFDGDKGSSKGALSVRAASERLVPHNPLPKISGYPTHSDDTEGEAFSSSPPKRESSDRPARPRSSFPGGGSHPPSGGPFSKSGRPMEDVEPSEAPHDDAFDVDEAPKKFKQGRGERGPSVRPKAGALDIDLSGIGDITTERARTARERLDPTESVAPPPPPPGPSTPPPALESELKRLSTKPPPAEPAIKIAAPKPNLGPPISGRTLSYIAAALITLIGALILITRPSFLFANKAKPVSGAFASTHLGASWTFPEQWLHAENLDDEEVTKEGWTRRVSVFYHGASPNQFQSQIVVVSFSRKDRAATEEDAKQLGANETMSAVTMRRCTEYEAADIEGTRCTSFAARPGQPLGVIEVYFPMDGRAFFLRWQFEVPSFTPSPDAQNPGAQAEALEERLATQIASSDALLTSFHGYRP
ncbi:MAG: hypothetical protein U0271_13050 [Polyangiaceae bacterium]